MKCQVVCNFTHQNVSLLCVVTSFNQPLCRPWSKPLLNVSLFSGCTQNKIFTLLCKMIKLSVVLPCKVCILSNSNPVGLLNCVDKIAHRAHFSKLPES